MNEDPIFAAPDLRAAMRRLRARLDGCGLSALLAAYGHQRVRLGALAFDRPMLPEPLRALVSLLMLGEALPADRAEAALGAELFGALREAGLVRVVGADASLGGLRLASHHGVLVLCETPRPDPRFYHGDDSLALGGMLAGVGGRVLDLCAGVGTQGILAARSADRVVSVERQAAVRPLFELNAALNGVEERIELRTGDLIEPVRGERFDVVACNPPLLPVPAGLRFPLVGDGGADGMRLTWTLLEALPELLLAQGRCHVVGVMLGDADGPFLQEMTRVATARGLEVLIILPWREPLVAGAAAFDALVQSAALCGSPGQQTAFERHFEALGATTLYSFMLSARLSEAPSVRLTHHYARNAAFWFV